MYAQIHPSTEEIGRPAARPSAMNPLEKAGQRCRSAGPMVVRSVAETAGLGRFFYIQGKSGKRYIFSAIPTHRSGLYPKAVLAMLDHRGRIVWTGFGGELDRLGVLPGGTTEPLDKPTLHAHLLSGDCFERETTVSDISL